jgi:ribonuclease Z
MGTQTFFVTHAHLDHMAALPVYVARRRMMKMEPPTIYLPRENVEGVDRMLKSWQRLDRGRMICTLNGVGPGDEIELSRDHSVTVFATTHTVPSVGYQVWLKRKKLKPEYQGMTGDQIRDIRLSGVEVSAEIRTPLVCYMGDTAPAGLDNYPPAYESKPDIERRARVAHERAARPVSPHLTEALCLRAELSQLEGVEGFNVRPVADTDAYDRTTFR